MVLAACAVQFGGCNARRGDQALPEVAALAGTDVCPGGDSEWAPACGLRVGCDDRWLSRRLEIGRPQCARAPNGLLVIDLPVRNVDRHLLRVGLQLAFLDESGAPYGDVTTRRVMTLVPGAVRIATFVSAKVTACTFAVRAARM